MKTSTATLEAIRASTGADASPPKPRIVRVLTITAYLCAISILLLGAGVFLGWLVNYEPAMAVLPGHLRMKPNAALLFIISALSLLLAMTTSPLALRWSRTLAVLTALGALLTLAEYLFHTNLGIDQLLFHDPNQIHYPGRMAPISTLDFTLLALSLLLLRGSHIQKIISHALSHIVIAISFSSIVGYLYGIPFLYGSGNYTAMAFHTGVGFLILALGIVFADPGSIPMRVLCAPGTGGWLVRRTLPGVILLPVLLGWFYLKGPLQMGGLRFGMALFAVTLAAVGTAALWLIALFLNRTERQRIEAERQRAEIESVREQGAEALRKSEQELRLVTDQLPTLISYLDPGGRFVRVNRTYESWTGQPAAAIVGRTIRELLGDSYWERSAPARNAALLGQTITFETLYPTIRGDRQAQITYAPDIDDAGQVRGLACMVLDIDDHRRAEIALRQSEKLAVVGRLASSIAHEINNPLEAVTNLLYLAEQDSPRDGTVANYMALAQQELARVTHIVVQTLRFHRQSTYPSQCKISDMVEQVLGLYQGRLRQAEIAVEQRFRSTEHLLCREGEVRQVLANLIGNAVDAMSASGHAAGPQASSGKPRGGRLLVRTRPANHHASGLPGVRVTIADTGHGISAEVHKRLFEPFHTTKGATGSGLGLWVSKEIVDRHGGHVRLRSRVHPVAHGTVFTVFLAHQQPGAAST